MQADIEDHRVVLGSLGDLVHAWLEEFELDAWHGAGLVDTERLPPRLRSLGIY